MTRILLTGGTIAVWLLGVWGMWRGWQARVARTSLAALPIAPELPGADLVESLVGVYLGTTQAGGWLERVAAARLGERSTGWLRVLPAGLVIRRPSYDDLFIPTEALRAARTDSAHAGRVLGPDGALVISWQHDGRSLETGFRGDDRSRHAALAAAIQARITTVAQPMKETL